MSGTRIDFNDLGKVVDAMYGKEMTSAGTPDVENLHAIAFKSGSGGRPCSRFEDRNVYVDRDFDGVVEPGHVWICSLVLSPLNGGTYFATPVREVDDRLLLHATRSDIASLADEVLKANPGFFERVYGDRIRDAVKENTAIEVKAYWRTYDAETARLTEDNAGLRSDVSERDGVIDELRSEIERLGSDVSERDGTIEELRSEIERLEAQAREKDGVIDEHRSALEAGSNSPDNDEIPLSSEETEPEEYVITDESDEPVQRIDGVLQTDPEMIKSCRFKHNRYSLHVAADWSVMVLRPDPEGTVECSDETAVIPVLKKFVHFEETAILHADFGDNGAIRICLPGRI